MLKTILAHYLDAKCVYLTRHIKIKKYLSRVPILVIYDEHDSTFRCKYLVADNVGRRRRWNEEGERKVSRSSSEATERIQAS